MVIHQIKSWFIFVGCVSFFMGRISFIQIYTMWQKNLNKTDTAYKKTQPTNSVKTQTL